ncbi:MAG: hypothetical protein SFY92_00550 [Verrucomicrobiae bacterium]|nr:hypothetical protein [Verrucomicrobiae bacterium]
MNSKKWAFVLNDGCGFPILEKVTIEKLKNQHAGKFNYILNDSDGSYTIIDLNNSEQVGYLRLIPE